MKLVVVKIFDDYISAHLVMARLQEENIVCFLQDENITTMAPFLSGATGGIKLMVTETQAERAKELIGGFDKNKES